MRKLILILFAVSVLLAQQENQSQSIELPDFVITGKQQIDLPIMEKSKADPVSLLSKDFFFPSFNPEQISLATVAKPEQLIANILVAGDSYDSQLILGAGQYTLPTGEFYLSHGFGRGKIYSKLWGTNRRDFVDYADYNLSGIKLGSDFYISEESGFLPGAIINVDGKFIRKDYYFYSTFFNHNSITFNRETQNITGSFSVENYYSDYFDYNLHFETDYIDIKDASTTELNIKVTGDTELSLGDSKILFGGKFQLQSVSKNNAELNYSFLNPYAGVEYKISKTFLIRAGAKFFSYDVERALGPNLGSGLVKEDLTKPWGELELRFNNNLSFEASYNPGVEFKTYSDMLRLNPYTHVNQDIHMDLGTDNDVTNYKHRINAVLKYGYKKYYELSVGATYFTADDYSFFNPDFSFDNIPGLSYKFHVDRWNDVTGYSVYANALYHLGPFGWFYGNAKYEVVETNFLNNDVVVPYKPKFSLNAIYGYDFSFGFSAELKLDYLKDTYADFHNIIMLDDYINFSAMLRYSLNESFDFTLQLNNLLNRDNYLWLGYIETPFDFTAGIDFRF